jgi:hypothetical protein
MSSQRAGLKGYGPGKCLAIDTKKAPYQHKAGKRGPLVCYITEKKYGSQIKKILKVY